MIPFPTILDIFSSFSFGSISCTTILACLSYITLNLFPVSFTSTMSKSPTGNWRDLTTVPFTFAKPLLSTTLTSFIVSEIPVSSLSRKPNGTDVFFENGPGFDLMVQTFFFLLKCLALGAEMLFCFLFSPLDDIIYTYLFSFLESFFGASFAFFPFSLFLSSLDTSVSIRLDGLNGMFTSFPLVFLIVILSMKTWNFPLSSLTTLPSLPLYFPLMTFTL